MLPSLSTILVVGLSLEPLSRPHVRSTEPQSCLPALMATRRTVMTVPLLLFSMPVNAEGEMQRLRKAESALALFDENFEDFTTECKYGELKREILGDASKERLLQEASKMDKSDTMVTLCKRSGVPVRDILGTTGKPSPLARMGALLEKPSLVQRVDMDKIETFEAASERLQQALAAADSSAFLSSNDFSAQNTFVKGESTTAPNLDAARDALRTARSEVANVLGCMVSDE